MIGRGGMGEVRLARTVMPMRSPWLVAMLALNVALLGLLANDEQ